MSLSPADLFKLELEDLLKRYPTVRLDVLHTINVSNVEVAPKAKLTKKKK